MSANMRRDDKTCCWFEFGDRGARWDAQRRTVGPENRSEDISEEKKTKSKDYSFCKDILVLQIILNKNKQFQSNLGKNFPKKSDKNAIKRSETPFLEEDSLTKIEI